MKSIKRLILLAIIIGLGFFIYSKRKDDINDFIRREAWYKPCERTIDFTVNAIDPKFNVSKDQVVKTAQESAAIWNDTLHREVFLYRDSSKSPLDINLLYDERQRLLAGLVVQKFNIEADKKTLEDKITAYNAQTTDLNKSVAALNAQVDYWNSRGGAPKDTYKQLTAQITSMKNQINQVNVERQGIENNITKLNTQVDQINAQNTEFNKLLAIQPEEGVYISNTNTIDIFFFDSQQDFMHTLTHEFGHALGVDHIANDKNAIMYPIANYTTKLDAEDLQNLENFCNGKNRFQTFYENVTGILGGYYNNYVKKYL